MPPGVKRTPCSESQATAAARSSTHSPTWFSAGLSTRGFFSGSMGCMRSTSTLKGPAPRVAMSSSTFSRSLRKLPATVRPRVSTHSLRSALLSGAPTAICWMLRTLKGRSVIVGTVASLLVLSTCGTLPGVKTALTGIKPTNEPHLGNYLGAIRPALGLAEQYRTLYFIADYHALTTVKDAAAMRAHVRDVAAVWLASGLD